MKAIDNKQFGTGVKRRAPWVAPMGLALSLVVALIACGDMTNKGQSGFRKNYGYLSPNDEVTDAFESYTVLPEYNYYFSGPDERPFAIIGIKKDVELSAKFWKPDSPTAGQLKNWMAWMNLNHSQSYGWKPRGYKIIDPDGNPTGVWYSACDYTVIKKASDGGITVYTPISGPCLPTDKSDASKQGALTDDEQIILKDNSHAATEPLSTDETDQAG